MISIKKYNDNLQYDWDDFIIKSKYGTIFHNQKFLSYHILKKFIDSSLLFYHNQKIMAVLPAAIITKQNKNILISHPGASFGGFIIQKINFTLCDDILAAFENYCFKNNIHACEIIQTPSYYAEQSDNMLEYVMLRKHYKITERYISHVIYLDNFSPLYYLNPRKRRYIKNKFLCNESYRFHNIQNISAFYKILSENKKKFSTKPTHSLEELKKLLFLYPKQCKLLGTFNKDVLVGGVFILFTAKASALLFYNAVSEKHADAHVGLFQIYQCIKRCINKRVKILDLGVSHLPNNKNPLDPKISLIEFKEQCGGLGVLRNIYSKKIKQRK